MPWFKVINSELWFASTIDGPGFSLDEDTPPGQAEDGWAKYPHETAASAALGVGRRVKGQDRSILDDAISKVQGGQLQAALISLRDNDPDPEGPGAQSQSGRTLR